jgi:hypothetical protein
VRFLCDASAARLVGRTAPSPRESAHWQLIGRECTNLCSRTGNHQKGSRHDDADPVRELHALYGHSDLGIHATVIEGGNIALGEAIEVLEPGEE